MFHPDFRGLSSEVIKMYQRTTWLKGLLMLSMAMAPALAGPAPTSSATTSTSSSSPSSTASNSTKRIVQYYGSPLEAKNHVHIAQLVNGTRPIYVTNVLFGTFTILDNNTMKITTGEDSVWKPDDPALDWAWSEMCQVQQAGVAVSMFLRSGFHLLNNETTFDARYAPLHGLLTRRKFDGIDLDIEDDAITLNTMVKLIRRLRADFGADFVITLAPVATALAGGKNLSQFSYTALEKQVGDDIAWYNAQFYGTGDLTIDAFDAVVSNGWDPARFTIGMASSPDFQTGMFPLSDLHAVFANITAKHPRVRGMAGFDYYDQCPGGWAAPWQWPIWAAAQLGIAPANATQSFQHSIKSCGANRV
ncbi:chitinase 3 [Mycena albidolilacea]|uniref:Chitinase 3 n=1 Tax=Mycena albidolilacea TaxID=1033008 RepID=A0AAD6ZN21_9AGAR|nr:chitinase 3 [Mycena albidolilacea]